MWITLANVRRHTYSLNMVSFATAKRIEAWSTSKGKRIKVGFSYAINKLLKGDYKK